MGRGVLAKPIQFVGTPSARFSDVGIEGNLVSGRGSAYSDHDVPGTADLISLHFCHGFFVRGNVLRDGGEVGITVSQQCDDGLVEGNRIESCDAAAIVIGSGTSVETSNVTVRRNTCRDNGLDRSRKPRKAWAVAEVVVYRGRSITVSDNALVRTAASPCESAISVTDSQDVKITDDNAISGCTGAAVLRRTSRAGESGP